MVRANGIKWHCFIHIIADIPNTCLCQETFFPLSIDLITVLFEPATVQMSPTGPVMRSPSLENSNLFPFHVPKRFYWGANMPTSMEKTWPLAFWHLDVCSACIFSFWCVVVLLMAILFWRLGSLRVPDSIDRSDESQSILWVDSQKRDSRETWGSVSF